MTDPIASWAHALSGGATSSPAMQVVERFIAFIVADLPAEQADRVARTFGYLAQATRELGADAEPCAILARAQMLQRHDTTAEAEVLAGGPSSAA